MVPRNRGFCPHIWECGSTRVNRCTDEAGLKETQLQREDNTHTLVLTMDRIRILLAVHKEQLRT